MPQIEPIEIAKTLTSAYGIDVKEVVFYRDGGSYSYVVDGYSAKYFLRVIREPFRDTALQSIDINLYLMRNDFPAPEIVCTKDGAPYHECGGNIYVLYIYIEGADMERDCNDKEIGSVTARMHNIMQSYSGELMYRDKHYYIGRYIDILRKKQYPQDKLAVFAEYGDYLWEKVKSLPRGFCHGDLYLGNLRITPSGKLYVLDFDTSCNGFPAYDMMISCNRTHYFDFHESGYNKTAHALEDFISGYTQHRTISEAEIAAVYDLIAVYHYQVQATVIETYGLDCVDEAFLDNQLNWLTSWRKQISS